MRKVCNRGLRPGKEGQQSLTEEVQTARGGELHTSDSMKFYAKCQEPRRHRSHCAKFHGDQVLVGMMVINGQTDP